MKRFAMVPAVLANAPSTTVHVYLLLALHANGKRAAWLSVPTLARTAKCRQTTVRQALAELELLGLITCEQRRGKPSLFHTTPIRAERGTPIQAERRS